MSIISTLKVKMITMYTIRMAECYENCETLELKTDKCYVWWLEKSKLMCK